jgi:hypothetical protein
VLLHRRLKWVEKFAHSHTYIKHTSFSPPTALFASATLDRHFKFPSPLFQSTSFQLDEANFVLRRAHQLVDKLAWSPIKLLYLKASNTPRASNGKTSCSIRQPCKKGGELLCSSHLICTFKARMYGFIKRVMTH